MKTLLSFFFACLLMAASTLEAQIVDRTTDRAADKTNRRIDNRIDRGLDKGLDSIENAFRRKGKGESGKKKSSSKEDEVAVDVEGGDEHAATMAIMQAMMGGGATIDLPDNYAFDHSVDYRTTMYNKRGKKETEQVMRMFFSDRQKIFGVEATIEGHTSRSIIDMERNAMVMLIDMSGSKMAMTIDLSGTFDGEDDDTTESGSVTKTGRTKTVLGMKCEEYIFEEDGDRSEMWFTTEETLDLSKAFMAMGEAGDSKKKSSGPNSYPEGMMMEMTTTAKDGEKTIMEVTSINRGKGTTTSTVGYSQMAMPGGR